MRRGVVSYSKVRAVTRVATPETEQTLLDVALAGTAAHVEQVVRAWRRVDRTAESADDRRRHASRVLHTWVDDDGMVVIRGRLAPEVGAVVRRALEAALDEQRRAAATRELGEPDPVDEAAGVASSFGQRQADALGMVAECALAGKLDSGTAGDRYQVPARISHQPSAAAVDPLAVAGRTPSRRFDVVTTTPAASFSPCDPPPRRLDALATNAGEKRGLVHADATILAEDTDAATLEEDADVPAGTSLPAHAAAARPAAGSAATSAVARRGQAALEEAGGIHVSAATAQRLACDAARVEMLHGPDGQVLDVGRKSRTISPALRRALAVRDRQCRFPAVRPAAATPTTFGTGRTAGRRRSTTWCCCAAGITGRCTKRGSRSRPTRAVRCSSCGPTEGRCPPCPRRPGGSARRWNQRRNGCRQPGLTSTAAPPRRPGGASGWTSSGRLASCGGRVPAWPPRPAFPRANRAFPRERPVRIGEPLVIEREPHAGYLARISHQRSSRGRRGAGLVGRTD